jgi:hypothetical protein
MPVALLGALGFLSALEIPDTVTRVIISRLGILVHPLLVFPMVLHMLADKDFRTFRFQVARPDKSIDPLSFKELIRPTWTLLWMTNVIALLPAYIFLYLYKGTAWMLYYVPNDSGFWPAYLLSLLTSQILGAPLMYTQPDLTILLAVFVCCGVFFVYPLIMALILKKRYKTFRFEIERFSGNLEGELTGSSEKTLPLDLD